MTNQEVQGIWIEQAPDAQAIVMVNILEYQAYEKSLEKLKRSGM